MNNQSTLGWDVGGAHLKAALLDASGQVRQVIQVPCPLWRGIEQLQIAIRLILSQLDQPAIEHAVTMTGELVDIFPNRAKGVSQIADLLCQELDGRVAFYAGDKGFIAIADVAYNTSSIASANWLASSCWLASQIPDALFVDIGSTTADLILLKAGKPQARGANDAQRMQYQELVYTGVVRTPLMAIAQQIPFAGELVMVAAEYFATSADIYRLTSDLNEAEDMADTADGGDKSLEASARRLARMVGHDVDDAPMSAWICLAQAFKQRQLHQLAEAASRAYSRNLLNQDAPIIGAGAGSFLAKQLALQLERPYINAASLLENTDSDLAGWINVCLPACAVAALLRNS